MRPSIAICVLCAACGSRPAPSPAAPENKASDEISSGSEAGSAPRVTITCDGAEGASYKEIRDLVDAGARGEPKRVSICALTTSDYGCSCPPFVFETFYNGGEGEFADVPTPYVMPVGGTPDPVDHLATAAAGSYVFTGQFDGRMLTGNQWNAARAKRIPLEPEEAAENWSNAAPVFAIESWCFVPNPEPEDYAKQMIDELKAAGVPDCP